MEPGYVSLEGGQTSSAGAVVQCPRCGQSAAIGSLVCPNCRALIYSAQLTDLSQQALSLEQSDPARAAKIWQACLELLPSDSQQFLAIYQRIGALTGQPAPAGGQQTLQYRPGAADRKNDPWPVAIAKTVGSMALSILVYGAWSHSTGGSWSESLWFAFGFVVLMLVHEMGHVFATWYYGLSASPPIFIPFIGALINLRQSPPNAKVEAIVGIGGPLLGTVGALVCYLLFLTVPLFHNLIFKEVAVLGFLLNFFNLLPVPPLDGGRITAAISPWLWIPGLIGLGALMLRDIRHDSYGVMILLLILFYGFPRIRATLAGRMRHAPYYKISAASSWSIGILYLALAGGLSFLMWQTHAFKLFFG